MSELILGIVVVGLALAAGVRRIEQRREGDRRLRDRLEGMRRERQQETAALRRTILVAATLAVSGAGPGGAQEPGEPDSLSAGVEDTVEQPKKKGLFGKVKSVAGNKVVKAVTKTAVCSMVPGGQFVAGALDAATSESAGEAAAGAAGAASGSSCMPSGLGGGVAGAAAGVAGAGLSPGVPTGMPGTPGMPSALSGHGALGGIPGEAEIAGCMGLTPEEYAVLTDPTGGEPRELTEEEMKRQEQLSRKVDMQRYQQCMMSGFR